MKAMLFIITLLGLVKVGLAQTEKLSSGDSTRIELERTALSAELIQLRDSISISILAIDAKVKKTMPSASAKLMAASKELKGYKDHLELDIEEITQTGLNSWRADSLKRIQLDTINTRREYKRIRTLL
jgi:hypothetical protein